MLYNMVYRRQHLNIELEDSRSRKIDIPWLNQNISGAQQVPFFSDAFAWEADLHAQTMRISGFSEGTMQVMPLAACLEHVHPDDAARIRSLIAAGSFQEHQNVDSNLRVRVGNAYRNYRLRGSVFAPGGLQTVIGVAFDSDCSQAYLERLDYLETHDELTGLFNAHMLDTFYEASLQKGMLPQSLIVASIDGLKDINETLGYQAGNTLIKSVSDVIRECFFDADMIARAGGGDFCAAFFGKEKSEIEHYIGEANMQLHKTYLNLVKANVTFGFAICEEKTDFSAIYSQALAHMRKNGNIKKVLSEACVIDPINEIIAQWTGWGKRVTRLSSLGAQVGAALNCSEEEMNEIRILSRIVDLGLIGIEKRLLQNRMQLTGKDKQEYIRHVEIGRDMIEGISTLCFMEPLYMQVYQRYEEENSAALPGCIMAAVVAFDDMTFERGAEQMEGIRDWLRRQKTRFCPEVVEAMMAITRGQ
jgi:diguanylate cyclase (GGDEF)-like protein